ncbi:RIKEN cDNA 1500032L24, isoform CRA_a [Mus musculus]|nr:RIKEN cDNA 1500032L24, isoform CRA_a [Mus musculus]EDL04509.1 RIKEN cDNA 1500032L24, isoform CRA_a [Mus musculus]EDL04510.1 RIKEN cDNA 1500032L24, isoform CRA_a [Mus musculus]
MSGHSSARTSLLCLRNMTFLSQRMTTTTINRAQGAQEKALMMWWHAQLPPVGRRVKESPQPHLLMVCDKSPESCALGGSLTAVHRVLEITSKQIRSV